MFKSTFLAIFYFHNKNCSATFSKHKTKFQQNCARANAKVSF